MDNRSNDRWCLDRPVKTKMANFHSPIPQIFVAIFYFFLLYIKYKKERNFMITLLVIQKIEIKIFQQLEN